MNRRPHLFALACLSALILGCGDGPYVQFRDAVNTWNEFADIVHSIPDDPDTAEKYAEGLLKGPLDQLKKKWEAVKKRMQGLNKLDKDRKPELEAALEDLKDEARFAIGRISAAVGSYKTMNVGGKGGMAREYGKLGNLRAKFAQELTRRAAEEGQQGKTYSADTDFPRLKEINDMLDFFAPEFPRDAKNAKKYAAHWNYHRYKAAPGSPGADGGGGMPGVP